jgi:hypothetical protein
VNIVHMVTPVSRMRCCGQQVVMSATQEAPNSRMRALKLKAERGFAGRAVAMRRVTIGTGGAHRHGATIGGNATIMRSVAQYATVDAESLTMESES